MPTTSTGTKGRCSPRRRQDQVASASIEMAARKLCSLSSPTEVKSQSLCPFPRDCWLSRPVAMIMRLEFDRKASNRKTYGVNLDALRLAHTREQAAQSPAGRPATPRPSGPASQAAAANAQHCAPQPGSPESLWLGRLSCREWWIEAFPLPRRVPPRPSLGAWQVLHN